MTKADSLRLCDVRDALRLIGECRDLGADPALWYPHMLAGMRRLFGVAQATGGEGLWRRPSGALRPLSAFASSADADAEAAFWAYHLARGQSDDPFFHALARVSGRLVTRTRAQLVPDAVWHRSQSYLMFREPARIGHEMTSVYETKPGGEICAFELNRPAGDREFSAREQRLLGFFHAETGRLLGGPLASVNEPAPDTLPPRLRQTLLCLVEGDSEKQIASRLGLSVATVHQYVTTLYRRFGVHSRAQLLAHVVRRSGSERWRTPAPRRY